jgi:hypothetical protein
VTAKITTAAMSADEDSALLQGFEVASAAQIESRSLQQRVDRKYVVSTALVAPLLRLLASSHSLLLAGESTWARYESLYFDSEGRDLYHAHRRGRMPRYKVRIRHHLDRELTFLELKRKERRGHTAKFRLQLSFGQSELGASERQFIAAHAPIDPTALVPAVIVSFQRLTLVGRDVNDRLTLDRDLAVVTDGQRMPLPPAIIAEVKQPQYANHLGAVAALRGMRAREMALSKYCLGTSLSAPVRDNVFKPLLNALERISA